MSGEITPEKGQSKSVGSGSSGSAFYPDTHTWRVLRVECPNGMKYPEQDSDGRTIYVNSHYATEAEAMESLIRNAKAICASMHRRREEHLKEIATCEAEIVKASAVLCQQNHRISNTEE